MPTRELVLRLRLIDPDMAARIVLDPTGEAVRESGARHEHGSAVQLRIRGDSIVACHGDCEQRLEDGVTVGGWELRGGPSKDPLDVSLRDRTIWSRPVLRVRALAGQPRDGGAGTPDRRGRTGPDRAQRRDRPRARPPLDLSSALARRLARWRSLGRGSGQHLGHVAARPKTAGHRGATSRRCAAAWRGGAGVPLGWPRPVLSIPPVPAPARHPPSKPEPEPEPEPKLAPAPPAPRRRLPPDLIVFAVVTGLVALGLIYLGSEVF